MAHVHSPLQGQTGVRGYAETSLDLTLKQHRSGYLDTVVAWLTARSGLPVTSVLLEGNIAEALCEQASARGADLVVMTTHGRGPVARSWLGSVADELVRRLPMPVLLVRPGEEKVDLDREQTLRHILIPLDGSTLAEKILKPALALGSLMGADYWLLRVIGPAVLGAHEAAPAATNEAGQRWLRQLQVFHEQDRVEAQTYLRRMAERLRAQSLHVETHVAVEEQPAIAISKHVAKHPTDLIALETHGRGGVPRLFLGSVADKVLRGAGVPVLVQRPSGK